MVRQIALTVESSDAHLVLWPTTELPPKERPPMALLEGLRTGSTMSLQDLCAQLLRFNLAGGRQAIAEFADTCATMPAFARPTIHPDRRGPEP